MLTMHVAIEDGVDSQSRVVRGVKDYVESEFGIGHSTVEIEVDGCADN